MIAFQLTEIGEKFYIPFLQTNDDDLKGRIYKRIEVLLSQGLPWNAVNDRNVFVHCHDNVMVIPLGGE